MTRIAALADLHGNLPALEAVADEMVRHAPDAVVVAGDLINLGPFSTEVLQLVFAEGWAAIRGNHEFYMLDYDTPRQPPHWRDFTTPRWLRATLPPALQRRVAVMPDTLALYFPDAPPLRIHHGLPHTHWDGVYPSTPDKDIASHFAVTQEETVIVGHVHLPQERRVVRADGRPLHVVNPGSAGLTLDQQPNSAPYALLDSSADGWRATFHRASYDPARLHAALDSEDYRRAHGPFARLYAAEFRHASVYIWPFQRWRAATCPDEPITEALVDSFLALGEARLNWLPRDHF